MNIGTYLGDAPAKGFMSGYLEALSLVERLHRLLLDVIKDEFERVGMLDINAVQALLLFNIGDNEVTAGELKTRGYYQGSNVSYNLKRFVKDTDMGVGIEADGDWATPDGGKRRQALIRICTQIFHPKVRPAYSSTLRAHSETPYVPPGPPTSPRSKRS
ncbi:MarR family transcriptional regulator [Seohaeicola zhoushanensis]|uniref:MarR family transcriptional regulator n=1 Tax=Seohaeicola zhoushanensis TaxID=1569283 RepID=A0A8J3MAB8_9RHOB|nr:helix-turn-helix domain-containing protein [Seohaeicola zhoushanensis]GHF66141.1 hypothetical protein GCM10017056_41780 [Seohaeicola zhoushanensis]